MNQLDNMTIEQLKFAVKYQTERCVTLERTLKRVGHEHQARVQEERARAEKAERTVAWLRSGGEHGQLLIDCPTPKALRKHLASEPPEDWKP